MNNHASLLGHCVAILDSFDPAAFGVDQHVSRYLNAHEVSEERDKSFITEVFAGCVRHGRVMEVIVKAFYVRDGRNCLRADKNLYTVLSYLALYRLDELGMTNYRKFIRSQDVNKMHKYMAFSFNEAHLKTWMKDEWTKIYESSYVQVELLSPIVRWLPELGELIEQLASKIANKSATQRKVKTPTEIKSFNITQPRPRSVPVPEKIPQVKKSKPVPKTTYQLPREGTLVAEAKERNRKRAEENLLSAAKSQFSCASAEKSEKTLVRKAAIVKSEESKLQFNKPKARKIPEAVSNNVPIKLNMAAILREGQLYQKREEDEMRKLEMLEAGAKDASDFLEWQTSMRQKDTEEQLADIERKRLEGKLSHEEAILARQSLIRENKEKVLNMKKEAEEMMARYVEKRMKEEEVMKKVVEDIISGHQNAKQAKVRVQEYNRKMVEEVSEESRELLQQALAEAEVEMRRKIDLIQEIRAMEAAPKDRTKLIDWTATAGHALLSEMSIAELKERVSLLRIAEEEERENKRDEILEAKEAKDRFLMDKLQQISKHRAAEGQAAAMKLETKRKTKVEKSQIKDPKLQDLQERLEQRKQERLKTTQEMKISPTKQSANRTKALISQKKKNEDSRWKELERRREKQASLQSQGIPTDVAGQKLNSFGRSRQLATGAVSS